MNKEDAWRFIKNNASEFGTQHAFVIALCGDEEEKQVLVDRIEEWCKAFPKNIECYLEVKNE